MSKKTAAAAIPPPTITPPPVAAGDIQISDGGEKGDRPGPKATPTKVDASAGIGTVSAADMNDRRWEAKKTALRALVQEQSAELAANAPKNQPLFGKGADDPIEGEPVEGEGQNTETTETTEEKTPEPKVEELAALAAKDRENRRLRRELKKVADAPKGVGLAKLKELAKSNPRGVAEMLGISLEQLNLAYLSGKDAEPVKLEEPKAAKVKDPERLKLEEERDQAVAEAAAARMREAQRTGFQYGQNLAATAKDEQGRALYPRINALGSEGVSAAMGLAFSFAGGKVDEDGKPLAKPRKMRPMTQQDGEAVVAHFFEMEEKRLAVLASKLNPGNGKPQPRNPTRPMQNGYQRPAWDPTNPHDPNNPRNRPDYRQIGDKVRARFFGPR